MIRANRAKGINRSGQPDGWKNHGTISVRQRQNGVGGAQCDGF